MLKPITTSIHTFRRLIEGGYLYVDKTELLWRLVEPANGVYFLSRPRRFGKSLTLSTFEEIFLGNRELFRGLAIYDKPFEWKSHPVIRLDLGDKYAATAEELKILLSLAVKEVADQHGVPLETPFPHSQFRELVMALAERGRVVILIDEYDKPILGNIENTEEATKIRDVLKGFYSVIKSADRHLRFAFLTGVSKFSRVSVFSDLNNLVDLTLDTRCASLCGYTQEELEANFSEYIDQLAEKQGCAVPAALDRIRDWYNGYRFSEAETAVYNPVSVGRLFDTGKFANYWFETGTPSFLLNLLEQQEYDLEEISGLQVDELGFSAYEIESLAPEPLLFQTGYITIRDYDPETGLYTLDYPNREVRNAFLRYLMGVFTPVRKELSASHLAKLLGALKGGDLELLFRHLRVFFENVPYDITLANEKYYQTIFYLVFKILGAQIDCEVRTAAGRIDAVVKTDTRIYLFEFKLHGTAEEALSQIRDKRYSEKYLDDGRDIVLVGAAFDPDTRNLEHWLSSGL